ncbi:MAG: ABC transporter ATP-binding protein [Limnochordales bacterium]|nr:MAG: ABC transporter ATP-binding protein [Bacillota bacterium]
MALLEVEDLAVAYGQVEAVKGISFSVGKGEICALLGANGAGKTTTLRALSGLLPARRGVIRYEGADITRAPAHRIVQMGIAHSPEGRRVFPTLTVEENLTLGGFIHRKRPDAVARGKEHVYELFPRLRERRQQLAGTLSGGEQQMLAIGRALMAEPKLLLLDEPSLGLAPLLVREIFRTIKAINETGVSVLLVEQNARMALRIAHTAHVIETGRIALSGPAEELRRNPEVQAAYLGGKA